MNIEEIFEYLPHRYPFLLVDRVTELVPGESIVGIKNATINEPFFVGHFPGHPVMPGLLIVEAMAQLAGVLAFRTHNLKISDGVIYYLAGIESVRFRRPVSPGDQIEMHAKILSGKRRFLKFDCQAFVDKEPTCSAEILVMERPF